MVYQEKNARTGVRQFCFDVVFSLYPPVLPCLGVQVAELEDARQHARQPRLSDHGDTRRPRRICGARQGRQILGLMNILAIKQYQIRIRI